MNNDPIVPANVFVDNMNLQEQSNTIFKLPNGEEVKTREEIISYFYKNPRAKFAKYKIREETRKDTKIIHIMPVVDSA